MSSLSDDNSNSNMNEDNESERSTRNPYTTFIGNRQKEKGLLQRALKLILKEDTHSHLNKETTPHLRRKLSLKLHRNLTWPTLTETAEQLLSTKSFKLNGDRAFYSRSFIQHYMMKSQKSHVEVTEKATEATEDIDKNETAPSEEDTMGTSKQGAPNTEDEGSESAARTAQHKPPSETDSDALFRQIEQNFAEHLEEERQTFIQDTNATETLTRWIELTIDSHMEKVTHTVTSIITMFHEEYHTLRRNLDIMQNELDTTKTHHEQTMNTMRNELEATKAQHEQANEILQLQLSKAHEIQLKTEAQLQQTQETVARAQPKETERILEMLRTSLTNAASTLEQEHQSKLKHTKV